MWSHSLIVLIGMLGLTALTLALWSHLRSGDQLQPHRTQPLAHLPTPAEQEVSQAPSKETWEQQPVTEHHCTLPQASCFLYRAVQIIDNASSLDSALERVMRELTESLAADMGRLFLLDDEEMLQLAVSVGSPSQQSPLPNWEFTLPHLALSADKPIIIPDLCQWPQLRSFISATELASMLWLPLKTGDRAVGALGLGCHQPNAFDENTVATLAIVASYLATIVESSNLREQLEQERALREALQRYVSPRLVTSFQQDAATRRQGSIDVSGRITVLFADVRSFTPLMEKADPNAVMQVLNEYFLRMSQIIQANGGMVDEFAGDQIVASFDHTSPRINDAYRAVRAGVEMLTALRTLQKRWRERGQPTFEIGIGICTGVVTRGSIGSQERKALIALGSILNIASRAEEMNKKLGTRLIITQSTFEQVAGLIEYNALGAHELEGISKPIPLYGVRSMKDNYQSDAKVSHDPAGIARVTQRRQTRAEPSSSVVGTDILP